MLYISLCLAERSKAWVCGCWRAGITSSNPAGGLGVCVVCEQVEVSARDWSLVQNSPTGCDREASKMGRPWSIRGCCAIGGDGGNESLPSRMGQLASLWQVTTRSWFDLSPVYVRYDTDKVATGQVFLRVHRSSLSVIWHQFSTNIFNHMARFTHRRSGRLGEHLKQQYCSRNRRAFDRKVLYISHHQDKWEVIFFSWSNSL